jgi:tetratricopeptide (TPR) repeat protein
MKKTPPFEIADQNTDTALSLIERAREACAAAKRHEETGDYEQARIALQEVWTEFGARPATDGFDHYTTGLVLLRAGALTGWLGNSYELPEAQERAKDLISESLSLFERHGYALETIESKYEMALCYWRAGAFDEARILLKSALNKLDELKTAPGSSGRVEGDHARRVEEEQIEKKRIERLRANLLICASIVECGRGQIEQSLSLLEQAEAPVEASKDDLLRGRYHVQLALALKKYAASPALTEIERNRAFDCAAQEFAVAISYFERAGHIRYCARIENNLAMLALERERLVEAHAHLDGAQKILREVKDIGLMSIIHETRARILIAQGEYAEAAQSARKAIEGFKRGGELSRMAEALTTEGTALARAGEFTKAESSFERAVKAAELAGNVEGAGRVLLTLIEEMTGYLSPLRLSEIYERADKQLSRTVNQELTAKLRKCSRMLLRQMRCELEDQQMLHLLSDKAADNITEDEKMSALFGLTAATYPEAVRRFEHFLIKQALQQNENRVTPAAKRLGISHQHLSFLLRTRHKELFYLTKQKSNPFKPRKRRRQTLIKK